MYNSFNNETTSYNSFIQKYLKLRAFSITVLTATQTYKIKKKKQIKKPYLTAANDLLK